MPINWSESEVAAAVEDYFNMLRHELQGQPYNKTEHRAALQERLHNRSKNSIEFKHPNISAVLVEMGLPYIDGYKPRYNYQRTLVPAIEDYLRNNPKIQLLFKADAEKVPPVPVVGELLDMMEAAPKSVGSNNRAVDSEIRLFNPAGVNYLEREAQNQQLGEAGEQFVLNFERARLIHAGSANLADQIEQVSATVGPSAGYDIRSFETNGSDRFIEAKTTKYGKSTPFFVTPNELRFSQQNAARYHLYRVFKFRAQPRLFTLQGHLRDQCLLSPSQYLARPA